MENLWKTFPKTVKKLTFWKKRGWGGCFVQVTVTVYPPTIVWSLTDTLTTPTLNDHDNDESIEASNQSGAESDAVDVCGGGGY